MALTSAAALIRDEIKKMAVSSPDRHITEIIENDAIITSHVFDNSGYMAWVEVGCALAHQGSR